MPDIINNAKEVYYSFRDDHGDRHMVPVRGVYVTGEYKPPSYIEPMLRLVSIKTTHPKIEEYTEVSKSHTSDTNHHLYDVDIDDYFQFTINPRTIKGSQPEPILRLVEVNINKCIVEDV